MKDIFSKYYEVFDLGTRDELDLHEVREMLSSGQYEVSEIGWEGLSAEDLGNWPAADREGRKVVLVTPMDENSYLQEVKQMAFVVG